MAQWINDGLHESAGVIHSFLLAGQSNMAGRGDLTPDTALTAPGCLMLRMGRWQPMSEPVNVDRAVLEGACPRSGASLAASFAARYAAEQGFAWYCTTLSISPMKDPVRINTLGAELGARYGVRFLPSEFRKKDGYKPTPVTLESQFNPVACINLLNVFAWGIDLATQKAFKWDNTYIEIEMEEQK